MHETVGRMLPARTFRPEHGEYADAQADLSARGKEMGPSCVPACAGCTATRTSFPPRISAIRQRSVTRRPSRQAAEECASYLTAKRPNLEYATGDSGCRAPDVLKMPRPLATRLAKVTAGRQSSAQARFDASLGCRFGGRS